MEYIIYYILIFFVVFQKNDFMSNKIGLIGNSFIPIIVPIIIIYLLIRYRHLKIGKSCKILIKLMIYTIFINLIILFVYVVLLNGDIILLGENALVKTTKGLMYLPVSILLIISIETITRKFTIKKILKPFLGTFLFLFLSLLIELNNSQLFNNLFHNGQSYNRVRLYTHESSFTGPIIVVYGFISLYYCMKYNKKIVPFIILMIGIFVINSGSRGFIIMLLLSIAVLVVISEMKFKYKFIIILLGVLSSMLLLEPVIMSLKNDIENYTSFSTRIYTIAISIVMIIKYPLGVGNFIYLKLYPQELLNNIKYMYKTSLNLTEINSYIYATNDKNISAKSGLFNYSMLWGIPSIVFMTKYFYFVKKKLFNSDDKNKYILIYAYIYLILAIITYISLDIKYEIWVFMTVVTIIMEKNTIDISEIKI